jgi:hypothetical protein
MDTEYLAALGTDPPFLFASNEMPYAELPDVFQIVDHAHAILDSIPLIQVIQPDARKAFTIEAVLGLGVHYLLTVLDPARDAGSRFESVVTSATGACFFIPCICATEAAVHSTGSDERRANHACLCRPFWHHVCTLLRLILLYQC